MVEGLGQHNWQKTRTDWRKEKMEADVEKIIEKLKKIRLWRACGCGCG